MNKKRYRRITVRECWRFMGFTDDDYNKAKWYGKDELITERPRKVTADGLAERVSDSQLYKQAGNSIVVQVLEEIFRQML